MMIEPTAPQFQRVVVDAAASVFTLLALPAPRYVSVNGSDIVVTCDVPLSADVRRRASVVVHDRLSRAAQGLPWVVRVTA